MAYNEKKSLYGGVMKEVASKPEPKHISDKMFVKALKEYGEVTHSDLVKAYGDYDENPLMVKDKVIDSMYVGRGVGLCLCYKENEREFEYSNQSIENFEYEDIKPLYDYISKR